ncbi:MAG: DNA polymerase III subunit psi [Litorilituus sp.]|jgi:DNA polymerase III psi subunit|nr:DNA polymerase III subunit psi [Litorilituus sp.]
MSITSRQFDKLCEMGISLWQKRSLDSQDKTASNQYLHQTQQSLTEIAQYTLFNDVLLSLDLTLGEVSSQSNHLNIGMFNWYFINEDDDKKGTDNIQQTVSYTDNKLITPSIETIAQSTMLKKQLWHTITTNLLS